jgi:alkaline phosphatase
MTKNSDLCKKTKMRKLPIFLLFFLFWTIVHAQPKNIIIMIGDGMGYEHINASLYFQGKKDNHLWMSFPVKLAAATNNHGGSYNPHSAWKDKLYVQSAYTESAAAATAIATGHTTTTSYVGMSATGIPLSNPVMLASSLKKSSGIVSSVPFVHATPAGFTAHNQSRSNYKEIAFQILMHSTATVVMGCGHPFRDNNGNMTQQPDFKYTHSMELWQMITNQKNSLTVNGTTFYVQDINGDFVSDAWTFSDKKEDLDKIISKEMKPDRLFFLSPVFETLSESRSGNSAMPFDIPVAENIPSLQQMSMAALAILSDNPEGFFLMIEGGAIDWASHNNDLVRLIEEQIEFEKTVEAVMEFIETNLNWEETLLIVLADHECGYLTGGFDSVSGFQHIRDQGKGKLPDVQFLSENHTNHLVPFFSKGIGAHSFQVMSSGFDSVRGQYIHISDVAKYINYLWGYECNIIPSAMSTCPGNEVQVMATAPFDVCSYTWFVNDEEFHNNNSHVLKLKIDRDTEVYCIIQCNAKEFTTGTSRITVQNCNE